MLSSYSNTTIVMFSKQRLSYLLRSVSRISCCFLPSSVSEQILYSFCRQLLPQKELLYLFDFSSCSNYCEAWYGVGRAGVGLLIQTLGATGSGLWEILTFLAGFPKLTGWGVSQERGCFSQGSTTQVVQIYSVGNTPPDFTLTMEQTLNHMREQKYFSGLNEQ